MEAPHSPEGPPSPDGGRRANLILLLALFGPLVLIIAVEALRR